MRVIATEEYTDTPDVVAAWRRLDPRRPSRSRIGKENVTGFSEPISGGLTIC